MLSILLQRPVIQGRLVVRQNGELEISAFELTRQSLPLWICSFGFGSNRTFSQPPHGCPTAFGHICGQALLCKDGSFLPPLLTFSATSPVCKEGVRAGGPCVFEEEKVSDFEETHTCRTFVPLSNNLINGAPVTCKRWSVSETAVIFSPPQSISIQ